jgi:hypothetical protein
MTVQEIVTQIEQLSVAERWMVMSELVRSLQKTARADKPGARPVAPADALRGIGRPLNRPPQTDEEARAQYLDYLEKKYQ